MKIISASALLIFPVGYCKLSWKMFTGIIVAVGEVRRNDGQKLVLAAKEIISELAVGKSIALNGVCLTIIKADPEKGEFEVEVSSETLRRTNLGELKIKDKVNLELPMLAGDRFDGHIVLGHIDTVGEIISIRREGHSHLFSFRVDKAFDKFLIEKGSVALDGISLTAFNIKEGSFDVAIIPHTYKVTNLQYKKIGDKVNVEFDVLGKYMEKLMKAREV